MMKRFFDGSEGNNAFLVSLLFLVDFPMILVVFYIKVEYLAPGFRTILVEIAYIHTKAGNNSMPTVSKITVCLICRLVHSSKMP